MVQKIVDLFNEKGHSLYGGEAVTQMEHALQAATYARKNNASDALITASLLHDIGPVSYTHLTLPTILRV